MAEPLFIDDTITHDEMQQILAVSGPLTLTRSRSNPEAFDSLTIISSRVTIKRHCGYFYAMNVNGSVIVVDWGIDDLIMFLRDSGSI